MSWQLQVNESGNVRNKAGEVMRKLCKNTKKAKLKRDGLTDQAPEWSSERVTRKVTYARLLMISAF